MLYMLTRVWGLLTPNAGQKYFNAVGIKTLQRGKNKKIEAIFKKNVFLSFQPTVVKWCFKAFFNLKMHFYS